MGREICFATSYGPQAIPIAVTTHHVPRTTNLRADPRVRPYDEMTRTASNEPQLQATSHRPHAAFSSFQPSESLDSREPVQTGEVPVARGDFKKQW